MAIRREWVIGGVLALLAACNTFDQAPDDSLPRDLVPPTVGVGTAFPQPAGRPAFPVAGFGSPRAQAGASGFGLAGAGGSAWRPFDAGPPVVVDADGGADDAGH